MNKIYDYLIIGAGSTGVHMAAELARRGHSVAVLDRTKNYTMPSLLQIPLFAPFILESEKWAHLEKTTPGLHLANRCTNYFLSDLTGGLAEMNGAVCFAGHKAMYERAFRGLKINGKSVAQEIFNASSETASIIYGARKAAWRTPLTEVF